MADWIWMRFGMTGRMDPGMKQVHVVEFGDWSTERGKFGGECGAPYCNPWRVCGVAVQKCVNHQSCRLGWCVGSVDTSVATWPIPKLL